MRKLLTLMTLMWTALGAVAEPVLEADDGWVRWVPPVSQNSAAYFTLHNNGDLAQTLVGVESDVASAVEMHTVVRENGLMRMQQLQQLAVPAQDCAFFEPGGNHIMLIGLKQPVQENQQIPLTLLFASGEKLQVMLKVRNEAGDSGEHQHH